MEAKERKGSNLTYLAVEPDGYDTKRSYPMVVLLHGFGSHMGDLAGLTPVIDRENYLYICPNAPISVDIGGGISGYAWAPIGETFTVEEHHAEELLAGLFDEVIEEYGIEPGAAVLGGFSQGAMMTYRNGLIAPEQFSGLAVLSGSVREPDQLRVRLPDDRDQAIFVAHGVADSMIDVEEARKARRFLEDEGYLPLYKEYPMGHEINQSVLNDLVVWIHEVL